MMLHLVLELELELLVWPQLLQMLLLQAAALTAVTVQVRQSKLAQAVAPAAGQASQCPSERALRRGHAYQ